VSYTPAAGDAPGTAEAAAERSATALDGRPATSRVDAPAPKISVRRLSKVFGSAPESVLDAMDAGRSKGDVMEQTGHVVAVRDVSFDVEAGEIFVIMGLSGSGKSTLVRMVNRLIEPTRGEVRIGDADLMQMSKPELIELRRSTIAMVFQSFALMPHLTNLENAAFGLAVAKVKEPERSRRAREALETVGLAEFAAKHPYELSGGMRQRVGLARALAVEPSIMLMDEAFSALDPLIRTQMQKELLAIQRQRGITVLFVSHDLDEALQIGDRIAIMADGGLVQVGTPRDLVMRPANDYVRSFFQRIDISKILTAQDVAEAPPSSARFDPARAEWPSLEGAPAGFVYVSDTAGVYRGVAERSALEAARRGRGRIEDAFMPEVASVAPRQRLVEIIDAVTASPCPVPVVDRAGRLTGVVSRTGFMRALRREDITG
jgi:glycine betaine/proline transport system ATP-binding protein